MSRLQEELEALRSDDGLWHAEHIVEWAQSHKRSALHKSFQWDDTQAAHEFRLIQARRLIQLHIVNDTGEPKLVSLTYDRPRGGGYRDLEDVAKAPELAELLLRDALADLTRVKARYKRVKELVEVWAAVEVAEAKQKTRRQKGAVAREARA